MNRGLESAAGIREDEVFAGKYRVERVLGAGGMGVLVAAHYMQLDERVALKFLLPEALDNREAAGHDRRRHRSFGCATRLVAGRWRRIEAASPGAGAGGSGGTYYRTYTNSGAGATDEADPATVSGLRMDKYLVTVGRFRQYVNYVTGADGAPPANGSGVHKHLNGGLGLANSGSAGTYETGWDATDWNAYIATGTGAASTWNTNLSCEAAYVTWTSAAGSQETLPINCVNWYEAYAFCIWDGGFLPSEAEWEYVAAGGSQQLEYPWGSTDPGPTNQYAIYSGYYTANPTFIAPVGTATLGAGYWGQLDMAGEVFEWTLEWYGTYVNPCTNCAYLTRASSRVVRGGDFFNNPGYLLPPYRTPDGPGDGDNIFGFRCARTP
jgi:formylglycine-generating enzyme